MARGERLVAADAPASGGVMACILPALELVAIRVVDSTLVSMQLFRGQQDTRSPRGQPPRSTQMSVQNTAHAAGSVRLHADHMTVKRLGNWTAAERVEVH